MKTEMTQEQRRAEKAKAEKFWSGLNTWQRWDLGDAFVLGEWDWREWLEAKPSSTFLNHVDALRISWEVSQ